MGDVLEAQEKQITGRRKTEGGKICFMRRAQSGRESGWNRHTGKDSRGKSRSPKEDPYAPEISRLNLQEAYLPIDFYASIVNRLLIHTYLKDLPSELANATGR